MLYNESWERQKRNAKHFAALKTFSLKKFPLHYTSFIIRCPHNCLNETNNPENESPDIVLY